MGYFSCRRESAVLTSHSQTVTRKLKLRIFRHEELESATSGFSPSAFLGRGSHGSVFLAALDGGRLLAAAKVPSFYPPDDPTTTTSSATDNEIDILSSLPRRSRRLVNLLGHTPAGPTTPRIAVVEFMPGGSLHDLLHSTHPPPWRRRVRLALQAAEAVASLHSLRPPVVHRDIKPSNVLIDGAGGARLGDFGLAVRLTTAPATRPAGTMGYIDPEYVSPDDVSTKTDVYSFGVLLMEIVSGRRPIDVEYSPPSLWDWAAPLVEARRFEALWDPRAGPANGGSWAARELAVLAWRCLAPAVEERPYMAEVTGRLRFVNSMVGSTSPVTWRRLASRVWNSSRNRKVSDVGT